MSSKMNVGILGSGYIATKMAEALQVLESKNLGINAYAIASRDLTKAKNFAEKWNFKKAYGSYQELAKDNDVDLIYIATPHSEHYSNILLCLNENKNLLVEKAFTANALQASEVLALAKEKNIFLCEAMWTRFLPAVNILKNWIYENRIGTVQNIEADFSQPISHVERLQNPALAGGALLDLGIYSITFADLILTDEKIGGKNNYIQKTDAECVKFSTGVDATDWINLTYKNGQKANLKTSMVAPLKNEGYIYGSHGFIKVCNLNDMVRLEIYNESGHLIEFFEPKPLANFYEYEVLACKEALDNGLKECPQMPLTKTIEIMTQLDNLRQNFGVVYPFEQSGSEIWNREGDHSFLQIYDTETGDVKLLKEFDSVIEAPNWSRCGKFLTYNSNGKIYKYEIETGKILEVPSYYVDNCNNDHVLSPDGLGLYVSHHTKEDGLSRIYKIFFDGKTPELITPLGPSYLHGVSFDGKTLAYCAERNGEYDIYKIPSKGGLEEKLTDALGLNDGPEFDCQGDYIWFNSVRTGRMQAWRMKLDGSEQTQMTFDDHLNTWFPHISPDLQKVVMVSYHEKDVRPGEHVPNKNVEIRLMQNINGIWSKPQTLLKIFGGQGSINVNSWAPDSRYFAFVSYKKK